jgi:hypothetical protein
MFRAFWTFFAVAAVCVGMAFAVMSIASAGPAGPAAQIDPTALTLTSGPLPAERSAMF